MSNLQDELLTFGTFLLNGQAFGVDLLQQREVLPMMPLTRVPNSSGLIAGVINLREQVIPVVNLRTRFGMPLKEYDKATRIINILVEEDLVVGFIVDSVSQVCRLRRSMIDQAPAVVASVESDFISGVGKIDDNKLLVILDIPKILSRDDLETLARMN